MMPTHTHITEYADPVLRPASPASSLGTAYGQDQTSFSDTEFQLSGPAFEKKCLERLELDRPRKDETDADKDPLILLSLGPGGRNIWVGDEQAMKGLDPSIAKVLSERAIATLSAEVNRLREDDLYEQTLLHGSKAALEPQPSTKDIDSLMQGMMGPSMDIGSGPYMGQNSLLNPQRGATIGSGITDGPWNNFGKPTVTFTFDRRGSAINASGDESLLQSSATTIATVGKRSRNGTSRNTLHK